MAISLLKTIEDHIAFICGIELAKPRYSLPKSYSVTKLPPDNQKEGYVVAGGLTAFTGNVKGQAKQDILNATLLAQLTSDRKYNRERETIKWYGCYNHILKKLGFVIEDFKFISYKTADKTVQIDKVVLEILSKIATGEESEVITATVNAIRELSRDDKKIALFDKHGSHSIFGNFQVCSCNQAPDGEVSLSLGVFYFKSNDKNNNFFFSTWDTECIKISCETQKLVLDSELYARLRSAVSAKLGYNAIHLVASIAI